MYDWYVLFYGSVEELNLQSILASLLSLYLLKRMNIPPMEKEKSKIAYCLLILNNNCIIKKISKHNNIILYTFFVLYIIHYSLNIVQKYNKCFIYTIKNYYSVN